MARKKPLTINHTRIYRSCLTTWTSDRRIWHAFVNKKTNRLRGWFFCSFVSLLFRFCYGFAMVLSSISASFVSVGPISVYDHSEEWSRAVLRTLAFAFPRINMPSCSSTSPTAFTCLVVSQNNSIACLTGKPPCCCRNDRTLCVSGNSFMTVIWFGISNLIDLTKLYTRRIIVSLYMINQNIARSLILFSVIHSFCHFSHMLLTMHTDIANNLCVSINRLCLLAVLIRSQMLWYIALSSVIVEIISK